jgi:hypothetical protein
MAMGVAHACVHIGCGPGSFCWYFIPLLKVNFWGLVALSIIDKRYVRRCVVFCPFTISYKS